MLPEAAAQLRELGFNPPPADVSASARRVEIRRTVARRIRVRREAGRRMASWRWWAPTRRQ